VAKLTAENSNGDAGWDQPACERRPTNKLPTSMLSTDTLPTELLFFGRGTNSRVKV
jgi:hypothetical protein